MSRVAKVPVTLAKGIEAKVGDGEIVVKGPLGTLSRPASPLVRISVADGRVSFAAADETAAASAMSGTMRALLANMVEGGQTPVQSAAELGAKGFRIVIFPGGTTRAVAHALQGYFASLATHGSTTPWRERMLDFDGLNALLGTPGLLARGRDYEG